MNDPIAYNTPEDHAMPRPLTYNPAVQLADTLEERLEDRR